MEQRPRRPAGAALLAVQSCWHAHWSRWGGSQPLSLQGLCFGPWLQRVEEAIPLSVAGPQQKGAQGAAPSPGDTKIRPLLLKLLSASDTVMPLSKKINIQMCFAKLNNQSYFSAPRLLYQGTEKDVLYSHTIPFPASGSAWFAHLGTAVSSPAENALKRGFSQWECLTSSCL